MADDTKMNHVNTVEHIADMLAANNPRLKAFFEKQAAKPTVIDEEAGKVPMEVALEKAEEFKKWYAERLTEFDGNNNGHIELDEARNYNAAEINDAGYQKREPVTIDARWLPPATNTVVMKE